MLSRPNAAARLSPFLLLGALVVPSPATAQEPQQPPAVGSRVMAALLRAPEGAYVVSGGRLAPAEDRDATPLFVQADFDHRGATARQVLVAVGTQASGPWTLQLEVNPAGQSRRDTDPPAARLSLSGQPGRVRDVRQLALAPGSYEIVAALVRLGDAGGVLGTVVRRPLVVPSAPSSTLVASPIVLGEAVSSSPVGADGEPFRFGPSRLTPAVINRFRQADRLHLALRVFGWKADASAKPDLTVEYLFQQQIGPRLRFFNKTRPQELNAATIEKAFDGASGEVTAGMSVPLEAFPPGSFQVTVRIRDKRTQASTVQTAAFVVTPS